MAALGVEPIETTVQTQPKLGVYLDVQVDLEPGSTGQIILNHVKPAKHVQNFGSNMGGISTFFGRLKAGDTMEKTSSWPITRSCWMRRRKRA